jgi:hypothetical protein
MKQFLLDVSVAVLVLAPLGAMLGYGLWLAFAQRL